MTPAPAARDALDAMIASPARHVGYSLDAIWRAVGCPPGHGPDEWLDLARMIADAMKVYRKRLHAATGNEAGGELAVRDPIARLNVATLAALDAIAGKGHGYELRDFVVDEELAMVYAAYLDRAGLRRNGTPEGKRSRRDFEAKLALLPDGDKVRRLEPLPQPSKSPAAGHCTHTTAPTPQAQQVGSPV